MATTSARKPATSRRARGRPGRYSQALAHRICERLANGEKWHLICNTDGLPSYTTLYTWQRKHPEFAEKLAMAREMAADLQADTALVVAEAATAASVQADRLRVSTLMKHAALAAPHRWGAKAEAAGSAPRKLTIYIRHFERVVLDDGSVVVREVPPEGKR
jgi:terminase small subunit-like protein